MARDFTPPMTDLNTTPLIDVMLVLLIIFMIAAPVMTHRIPLPTPSDGPAAQTVRKLIEVSVVDGQPQYRLDDQPVGLRALNAEFSAWAAMGNSQPTVQLFAAEDVRFEDVAVLLASGRRAGVRQIGLAP